MPVARVVQGACRAAAPAVVGLQVIEAARTEAAETPGSAVSIDQANRAAIARAKERC